MLFNRKGDAERSYLLEILVMIGVVILLVVFFVYFGGKANTATQDTLCKASVLIRGQATVTVVKNLVEFEKITPLACNTQALNQLKGSREQIKKIIADEAARCWWKFAEGSVSDLFKVDRKEKACFVCYTFNVADGMDLGESSKVPVFEEPKTRAGNSISSQEMTNYLVSTSYNPAIIYGGGTKNYYGIDYNFDIPLEVGQYPRVIKTSTIKSTMLNGFVMDYWFKVDDATKARINRAGNNLQFKDSGNIMVIVAEDFKSMENSDARDVIEGARLNSNTTNHDAILLLVSIKQQRIRVLVGEDQSIFLKDYMVNNILERNFNGDNGAAKKAKDCQTEDCKIKLFNDALASSVESMAVKLINEEEKLPGIDPRSYYYYLTNGGTTWTMISDIDAKKTYAITYVSASDATGWTGVAKIATYVGAGVGVIGGAILVATGVGAPVGGVLVTMGASTIAGAGIGYFGTNSAQAATGGSTVQVRPNNILIVPVNSISSQCTMVE